MLRQRIETELSRLDGIWGVAVKNLTTGEEMVINGDHCFNAASVIKVPIMLRLLQAAEAGELGLEEHLLLTDAVKVPGCGVLKELRAGLPLSLWDLCTLMIIISDNTATNMLIDRLGIASINAALRGFGIERSTLRRRLFDREAAARGVRNEVTPADLMQLLTALYRQSILTPSSCERALAVMARQQMDHKLPVLLPQGVRIAHKTGEDSGITHDVGIIYGPQPFTISVMSEQISDTQAGCQLIARLARMVWDYYGASSDHSGAVVL